MSYTISEAAQKTGLPPSTIRFYDKEGLLPNIKRKNGIRVFEDMDLRLMGLLTCLKNTGMPIKRIRDYVELTSKGDDTLQERYEIIKAQRQFVLDQIEQLQNYLEELDFKDWYYNKALAAGSESAINAIRVDEENHENCVENYIGIRAGSYGRRIFLQSAPGVRADAYR